VECASPNCGRELTPFEAGDLAASRDGRAICGYCVKDAYFGYGPSETDAKRVDSRTKLLSRPARDTVGTRSASAPGTSGRTAGEELAQVRPEGSSRIRPAEPTEQVGAHEVFDSLAAFVRRFVVLSDEQTAAVVLWIVHTHAFDAAHATGYLAITSAEKRSGKTRLLEVLELLVAVPWLTGRTTAAALVRKIAGQRPTLLLDESDAAFNGDKDYAEALRGILNSGHRAGGCASLCVGQGVNIEVRDFPVFSPKAIAGIGSLPDTVADRAIPIRLKRRAPGETVERFRRRDVAPEAESIRDPIAEWAEAHIDVLGAARPELPAELDDRAADTWEPLLAIADLAGGDWPIRARQAAVVLSADGNTDDVDSLGVRLLSDA
jgi:uncharacterized protein DUF3631